jgi:hypothetical protein
MATNTYVALDKITLGSNQTSVTFSSIPSTYTDLVLVAQPATTVVNQDYRIRFNGDTASNYSATYIEGDGSTAYSNRWSNVPAIYVARGSSTTLGQDIVTVNINNYSNATTYKTAIARFGLATTVSARVSSTVGLWRSTSAITSITVTTVGTLLSGSTFSLYGIAASNIGAKATGGIITSDATYYYHAFNSSGTFTPLQSLSCDVLQVAGGGGGGGKSSYNSGRGGGGAGGLLAYTSQSLTATGYTVTVGGGGNAGSSDGNGSNGSNSQFASLTASVGGGGGGGYAPSAGINGASGGSGGGGGGTASGTTGGSGGAGTSGQGFVGGNGGNNASLDYRAGGGGGGAGAGGSNATGTAEAGAGGVGSSTYSSWNIGQYVAGTYYLAGGGAGGSWAGSIESASGGYGGGGNGAGSVIGTVPVTSSTAGSPNTGGGGGGGGYDSTGSAGGSGVVVIRYLKV